MHLESTEEMEAAKHHVFAIQTIGGKTLLEMTRHNQSVFDNRESPGGHMRCVYMTYVWITCQHVSPVIMPHIPEMTENARVCTHA